MGIRRRNYLGPYIECLRGKDSPHRYDLVDDEMSDVDIGDESKLFLIPNVSREGEPSREIDWDGAWHFDLQGVDMAAEINWLRSAFAVGIAAIEKAYDKVVLRWGLIQEWS